MAEIREPPRRHHIQIEHKGRVYKGRYAEEAGGVTVFYALLSKWAMLYSGSPEHIATLLLRELIDKWERGEDPQK